MCQDHACAHPVEDPPVQDSATQEPTGHDPRAPLITAEDHHRAACIAWRRGNLSRLEFVKVLLAIRESLLYQPLGHPTIHAYALDSFKLSRSSTEEHLRVAEKLDDLPRLALAFASGKLSWSHLRELVRVAEPDTEERWLKFAQDKTISRVAAEVQDTLKKGRKKPREDTWGLPSIKTLLVVELTSAEQELVDQTLAKVAAEIRAALPETRLAACGRGGGPPLSRKELVLFIFQRFLETDAEGIPKGRVAGTLSPYTVVYLKCPHCREPRVMTDEGPVEVEPGVVDRVAPSAQVVKIRPEEAEPPEASPAPGASSGPPPKPQIDPPTSRRILRKVIARDGIRCANPACRRKIHLQGHHLTERSKGGKTAVHGLCTLCDRCHSLVTAGLLEIKGNLVDGLRFEPRARSILIDPDPLAGELAGLRVLRRRGAPPATPAAPTRVDSQGESTRVATAGPSTAVTAEPAQLLRAREDALALLSTLGYRQRVARMCVARALDDLERAGKAVTSEELIKATLGLRADCQVSIVT